MEAIHANLVTRPVKMLLVDDDPSIVRFLSTVIQRCFGDGIEMESLTNSEDAQWWIENRLVDILITDLEMPDVDGVALLRCAKQRNAFTQVLLVTGHSTLTAVTTALELGATDYLLKPIDRAELVELIGDVMKRLRRWRTALAGSLTPHEKRPSALVK